MIISGNKTPQLKRINLSVTRLCNLHCRMCDLPKLNSGENDMTLDKLKAMLSEAAALGAKTLELGGGEPMMHKDIYEIISYAASLGMIVFMATNGVLIGENEVKRLIDAGLRLISFSLEGPESLNNQIRGQGNFQKTLNAIKGFLSYKPFIHELQVNVGFTLSKYNYKSIVPFSKYLIEEVGIDTVSINPINKSFLTYENQLSRANEFEITADLMEDLTKEMEQLIKYGESIPGKLPTPGYLKRFPDYFMGKKIVPMSGCTTPLNFLGISASGRVFSCWHDSQVGDLNENSLTEILTSESWQKACVRALNGKCKGCLASCYFELY